MKKNIVVLLSVALSTYVFGYVKTMQPNETYIVTTSNSEVVSLSNLDQEEGLVNLSARLWMDQGDLAIPGFVLGNEQKILARVIGPTLKQYGVTNAESSRDNPAFRVGTGYIVYHGNELIYYITPMWWQDPITGGNILDYMENYFRSVGAFPLSADSAESAAVLRLGPGAYTLHAMTTGTNPQGIVLVEIYGKNLLNLSIRGKTFRDKSGEKVVIAGFVIGGKKNRRVLVRAVGPGLMRYGVVDVAPNPVLSIYHGQPVIATNDDWGSSNSGEQSVEPMDGVTVQKATPTIFSQSGAFALDNGSTDSALVLDLPPGAYTAIAKDGNGGSDIGQEILVEIYDITTTSQTP